MRTALIDMDPLSNLATILDLPSERLGGIRRELDSREISDYRLRLVPSLDLLFPHPNHRGEISRGESALYELVFERFAAELAMNYDRIIPGPSGGNRAGRESAHLPPPQVHAGGNQCRAHQPRFRRRIHQSRP
jgi:cellulose biosynthesis protein BcsQ